MRWSSPDGWTNDTDSARRERDANASAIRDGRGGGGGTAMVVHRRCGCCHCRHHPPLSIPPTRPSRTRLDTSKAYG